MRVRPPNKEEEDGGTGIQKVTEDSLTISGQTFTFDSIADVHSKQARSTSYELSTCLEKLMTNNKGKLKNGELMILHSECASQVDIFELVGAPLVENCLAGFNSSVFAYGQVHSFPVWIFFSYISKISL